MGSQPRGKSTEGFDSKHKNGLTFLAPLTYPLIIEELRPEDNLAGASFFPTLRILILSLILRAQRIGISALPR